MADDCDDANGTVHPSAAEVCNGVDDDCDGTIDDGLALTAWYADVDADGYGDSGVSVESCVAPDGYVADDTDCDDTDPTANPGIGTCGGATACADIGGVALTPTPPCWWGRSGST